MLHLEQFPVHSNDILSIGCSLLNHSWLIGNIYYSMFDFKDWNRNLLLNNIFILFRKNDPNLKSSYTLIAPPPNPFWTHPLKCSAHKIYFTRRRQSPLRPPPPQDKVQPHRT